MSKAATVYLLQEEDTDLFETPNDFLTSPALAIGPSRHTVLCGAVARARVLDLRRRRAPGDGAVLLGAVALLVPFLGTLTNLIVRPPEYLLDSRERELEVAVLERELRQQVSLCLKCRSIVEKEFLLCPECGSDLKKPCENCQRPLHLAWNTCPLRATVQSEKNVNW